MATRTSTLELRLIDGISGPGRQAGRALNSLGINAKNTIGILKGLGVAFSAYELVNFSKRALKAYADEEANLTRIGLRANASRAQMREAHEEIFRLSQREGVLHDNTEKAFGALAVGGRTVKDALALLGPTIRAANVVGTENFAGLGKAVDVLNSKLGLSPAQITSVLDMMVAAHNRGRISVEDMAEAFPRLIPQMQRLGWTGVDGMRKLLATTEAIREQTGDSASAFAAMDLVFNAVNQRQSKRFEKLGVDIKSRMYNAVRTHKDLVQTYVDAVWQALGGTAERVKNRLGELFQSEEQRRGIWGMIAGVKNIADNYKDLGNTAGTVARSQARLSETEQARLNRLSNAWEDFTKSWGLFVAGLGVPEALESIAALLKGMAESAEKLRQAMNEIGFKGLQAPEGESLEAYMNRTKAEREERLAEQDRAQEAEARRIGGPSPGRWQRDIIADYAARAEEHERRARIYREEAEAVQKRSTEAYAKAEAERAKKEAEKTHPEKKPPAAAKEEKAPARGKPAAKEEKKPAPAAAPRVPLPTPSPVPKPIIIPPSALTGPPPAPRPAPPPMPAFPPFTPTEQALREPVPTEADLRAGTLLDMFPPPAAAPPPKPPPPVPAPEPKYRLWDKAPSAMVPEIPAPKPPTRGREPVPSEGWLREQPPTEDFLRGQPTGLIDMVSIMGALPAEAAEAGKQTGESFHKGIAAQLDAARATISDFVNWASGALSFSTSPTVTPEVEGKPGTSGPGRIAGSRRRGRHADIPRVPPGD